MTILFTMHRIHDLVPRHLRPVPGNYDTDYDCKYSYKEDEQADDVAGSCSASTTSSDSILNHQAPTHQWEEQKGYYQLESTVNST